ncbi:MAG TPA: TonB-dependent receptor [Paludibacter sp.]|nr:TonB-dependent receptor [Paludibacter sp.]
MKKIFLVLLVSILSFPLMAEVGIKGTIVDAGDQSPLDFVNIALFKPGSKTPVTGVSTDNNGIFNIPTVANGKYNLRISYVGYSTVNQVLEITGKTVNLGIIKLDEDSRKLKEVEVVAQGSQMHFDIDKKVFSVDQNISASGGSASDVLKNIPSVTVDNEGNVSLRKDGNVEVWINGKASGLTADNRAQVLQQLPAESIESVEIMTNPSAKFNPEGSAGIINIVMKKNRKAGYYGSVSGGTTYPDGGKLGKNLGASINYSSSKVDAYVNLGYRAMSFKGGGTTNRTNFDAKDSTLLNQNYSMKNSFSGVFMRAGIDYHLDTKNTLSLSGFGMAGSGNSETNTNYLSTNQLADPAAVLRNYSRNNTGKGTRPSLNMNLDYRHEFDKKGTNLNASLSYSHHNRTSDNTYVMNDVLASSNNSNISQSTDGENKELEFKVDYTNKLTENSKLEAGWQSNVSNRLSTSTGINNVGNITIPSYYDNFDYNEQIHAGYLTYGNRIDKFSYQLGLRAEYMEKKSTNTTKAITNTGIDTAQVIPSKTLFHLFPSVYLSYNLPNNAELQLNYTNRVNRPRGQQINPYRNFSDSTNITYGNPDLAPQYSSSMELNFVKSWNAQSLSASAYYHSTDNVIENVRFLHNGVMESTFMNIAKSQNTGLELIAKNRLFRILNLTSSLNLYYSKLDSAIYKNPYNNSIQTTIPGQSDFSWSANVLANFMLTKTFSGQITAEYESSQLIAQGKENAKYTVDLGVRKTFLDRKLSLSMNVRDLLNSDKNKSTTSGSGFYQNSSSYFHGRMFGVTLSYNFGNMKAKQSEMKKKEGGSPDMNMDNPID